MPLAEVDLSLDDVTIPAHVDAFLEEADSRVRMYMEQSTFLPTGFAPSHYQTVYKALQVIAEQNLAPGNHFCEWGSGLGIVASLADMLHFDSSGIEIDGGLVDAAQDLADDFGLEPAFVQGSFIPEGDDGLANEASAQNYEGTHFLITDAADGYSELGLELDDFDVVFAYPWPGEERVVEVLFEKNAAEGALLLLYCGYESVRVLRQVSK